MKALEQMEFACSALRADVQVYSGIMELTLYKNNVLLLLILNLVIVQSEVFELFDRQNFWPSSIII